MTETDLLQNATISLPSEWTFIPADGDEALGRQLAEDTGNPPRLLIEHKDSTHRSRWELRLSDLPTNQLLRLSASVHAEGECLRMAGPYLTLSAFGSDGSELASMTERLYHGEGQQEGFDSLALNLVLPENTQSVRVSTGLFGKGRVEYRH